MILEGRVKAGLGEAGFWVKKILSIFEKKEGTILFPGTLNIELNDTYNMIEPDIVIAKEEYGGTENLFIKRCKILENDAYIVRTEKNSTKNGDHPLSIIEILSYVSLRKKLELSDGDIIKIKI